MSTKINARSPFFIEATEPTVTLGIFDCTTANLLNFAVNYQGGITEPTPAKGIIIDRSATSFPENTTSITIPRSVTYTIRIPDNYSNTNDGTYTCTVSTEQAFQTTQDVGSDCPTLTGTSIPNITNLSTTTINLATYFTQPTSSATISGYSVTNLGDAAISTSVSGNTLTISTGTSGASTILYVTAFSSVPPCTAVSNTFSVSSTATKELTCTTQDATNDAIDLQGGDVSATGVVTLPSYSGNLLDVKIGSTSYGYPPTNVPANTGSTVQSVTLTFVFEIYPSYTNAADGTIDCNKMFEQQPTTAPKPNLECSDVTFRDFRITDQGNIIAGTVSYLGSTNVTPTNIRTEADEYKYDVVASSTPRTVSVTFRVLNTNWLNNNTFKTCPLPLTQPPSANACDFATGDYAISSQGFTGANSFCGDNNEVYSILVQVNGTPSTNNTVCFLGDTFDGGGKWYAYNTAQVQNGAGNINNPFKIMQIDSNGTILATSTTSCANNNGGDNQF